VQDEIARIIVNKLRESIAEKPKEEQFVKQATENIEAYSLYLQGVYFRNKLTPPDVRKAIEYFEKTMQLDSRFAPAPAQYAGCYVQLGAMGQMNPHKAFEIAHRYADIAIELDNTLAEAYVTKGAVYLFYEWNWAEGHKYISRALQLNPGSSFASFVMAMYHHYFGQLNEAIEVLEKAMLHDPLSIFLMDALSEKYFHARRYDDSLKYAEKILELDPQMRHALEMKGFVLGMKGKWNEAITIFEQVHRLTNHPLHGLQPLGYAYAKTGQVEKAMECIRKIEQRQVEEPEAIVDGDLAFVWWALGDVDKTFEYFFSALDKRLPITPYALYSPLHEGIQKDPRAAELKRRMNL
jgi:tetratricopeptide (TPR) repeat protein